MKVRTDFVTNSSSSSFIIATKQSVPEKYKSIVQQITKDNIFDVLKENPCYWNEWDLSCCISDEELKKEEGLTDEQFAIIKLAVAGGYSIYKQIMESLDKKDAEPIYMIFVERDYLYYADELNEFIENATLLEKEGY